MATIKINELDLAELSEESASQVKGGPAFDAFLEIDGIKGETKDRQCTEQYALNFSKL